MTRPLPLDALDATPDTIASRFRWARGRGHPHYLWPDVPLHAWRRALLEIARVSGPLTAGAAAAPAVVAAPARALGIAALTSGMGPLLGYWVETGRLGADEEVAALLAFHLAHGRRRQARMDTELHRVVEVLSAVGVGATVLKGMHTARVYFPDPGTRPSADIDLLIAPDAAARATRALHDAGYRATFSASRPHKSGWAPPGAAQVVRSLDVTHADNPVTIDLHTTLAREFHGIRTVDLGPADGRTAPWPTPNLSARVLAQPLLLAFLAVHASEELHHLQLIRLVELALVLREDRAAGRVNWPAAVELLRSADALRFAYPALELAERLVPGTVDPAARNALTLAAPLRMRRRLEHLRPGDAQQLERVALADRFLWASGAREWLRRAGFLLWPGAGGRSPGDVWRIYVARIVRLLRGKVSFRPDEERTGEREGGTRGPGP